MHKLRTYACDVLETEFLSDVQLPRDARIMILNTSLSGFRDKVITCLENISKNIVEGERIVTKGDIATFIDKMRADREYGDITLMIAMQQLLSPYAVIAKCWITPSGVFPEEL